MVVSLAIRLIEFGPCLTRTLMERDCSIDIRIDVTRATALEDFRTSVFQTTRI
jgi:hypothetical protein